jgi:nitrous oxidase accessory protein
MRHTDNRFDDGRHGNFWSDNAPYDLDGDGVADVPYSPVTAFAFVSKQYPDLTILARSPAVAALGVAERVFPALQPSDAVDRRPQVSPVSEVAGAERWSTRRRPAWGAGVAFLGMGVLGALGVARARSVRP